MSGLFYKGENKCKMGVKKAKKSDLKWIKEM